MISTQTYKSFTHIATTILLAVALWCVCHPFAVRGQEAPHNPNDSLTVSIITCWPGPEIYELCGHQAMRVRGAGIDSVWNYGMFSFNQPNFIYRFVKGETDYMVGSYPFVWFLPEYVMRGSRVVEQDLNLSQEEARTLLARLRTNALPQNRTYRYNYVLDNCATRLNSQIDTAVQQKVIYPDTTHYGTFRNEMRAYHEAYPWYQFGIDMALGTGLDRPISAREEMFVPLEAMRQNAGARFADGRPLVRETRVLNEGGPSAALPPTPWWKGPLFWSWMVLAVAVIFSIASVVSQTMVRWVYSLWFLLLGMAGLVITFLVFFSSHEATSPNVLLIWLNPLQLIFAIVLWWRTLQPLATALAAYNVVAIVCLLAVWPLQSQSANPAFFPLLGTTLILAVAYLTVRHTIFGSKKSYNINSQSATIKKKRVSRQK